MPRTSQLRDKLAHDSYHRRYDLSPSQSDYNTYSAKRGRSGYVGPARREFVRSRPRSLTSYGEASGTRTGKKALLDGQSQVEVTLCSVM